MNFSITDPVLHGKADRLERALKSVPQVAVGVHHCVNGGVYTRTGVIPADTAFVGAVHKKDHINIIFGDVTISTDEGPIRLTGHNVIKCPKGARRVAYTHSQTTWTTVLHTDLTDIREIEAECVESASDLQTQTTKGIESCS